MRGKAVCLRHGGKSPGGPLKHGRYSEKLGPLSRAYASFMQAEDLNDLRPGLAALDAWMERQVEMARAGDGVDFRAEAVNLFGAVDVAITSGDVAAVRASLESLRTHLTRGASELKSIARAMETLGRRQHHTERAREIELRGEQVITARALLAFLNRVVDVIRQELPKDADRVLRRLTDEVVATSRWGGGPISLGDPDGDAVRGLREQAD